MTALKGQVRTGNPQLAKARSQRDAAVTDAAGLRDQVSTLTGQVTTLQGQVTTLTTERDQARTDATNQAAEVTRLKGLIISSVETLANAWKADGNAKTDVSYYSADNYWSYTFTYCGFC